MSETPVVDWFGRPAAAPAAARLAALYDLDFGDKVDDLDFFRQLARRTGGPILELACGTGRVALALAADGHRVVGLDISEAMLERARRKARDAKLPLELVRADMRDFAVDGRFALAIVAFGTFLVLAPEERRPCLARIRGHLAPGGLLAIDVFQPDPEKIAAKQGDVVHEWTREDPETGRTVTKLSTSHADVDGVDFRYLYDEVDATGAVRRHTGATRLHYLYHREFELLLEVSGFEVAGLYGSYELDAVTPRSPKLLAVGRRRERVVGERRGT